MSRKELPLDPEPTSTARNMPRELRAPCWRALVGLLPPFSQADRTESENT